jgi:hypothetical protein
MPSSLTVKFSWPNLAACTQAFSGQVLSPQLKKRHQDFLSVTWFDGLRKIAHRPQLRP